MITASIGDKLISIVDVRFKPFSKESRDNSALCILRSLIETMVRLGQKLNCK
jgi:hypothetical protein